MDAETSRVLFEQALIAARKKGVPEEELAKAKKTYEVYDLMMKHDAKKREDDLNEHRKSKGLPSLRNRDAHKR